MEIQKGIITGFSGSWMSGLGYIHIQDSDEPWINQSIPCDNASTVRALDARFGNVIGPGHTVNNDPEQRRDENGRFLPKPGHLGKEIFWSYDEIGMIFGGFTPVEEASPELVEAYETQSDQVDTDLSTDQVEREQYHTESKS